MFDIVKKPQKLWRSEKICQSLRSHNENIQHVVFAFRVIARHWSNVVKIGQTQKGVWCVLTKRLGLQNNSYSKIYVTNNRIVLSVTLDINDRLMFPKHSQPLPLVEKLGSPAPPIFHWIAVEWLEFIF